MGGLDYLPDVRDGLTAIERSVLRALPGPDREAIGCKAAVKAAARDAGLASAAERYAALTRLAQSWRARYPLVDGDGNFGSFHDDPPADPKFTKAKLGGVGQAVLGGEASAPLDGFNVEPVSIGTGAFPSLLANGSWEGVTALPPHNLAEVCVAISARIDDPAISLERLMELLPGPDFPTGGQIVDPDAVRSAYLTGAGNIKVRARIDVTEATNGTTLVTDDLPYLANWGGDTGILLQLVEGLASGHINGVKDVGYDDGALHVELNTGADPDEVLAQLYAQTDLESTVRVLMLAFVDGVPRQLPLIDLIDRYIDDQRNARTWQMHPSAAATDVAIKADLADLVTNLGDGRRTLIGLT